MSVQIVVFNALGLLAPDVERDIRLGIDDGLAAFRRHAKVEDLGVAVHPHGYVSGFTGLGGMNYGPESFAVFADESYAGLRIETRRRAAAVTVHELHHALRTRSRLPRRFYSDPGLCAGEILIMEGLAIHSEYFLGFGPALSVSDVSSEAVDALIERVAPIIDDPHAAWRWIHELNGLPAPVYQAMYPMGHRIVAAYLSQNRANPIEVLAVPWRDFWRTFQAG